ncbi:DUF2946 family protein [Croceicoccus naphthovorans]|uniref:Uncharacterized protein n=1 Tax=Croceicoccus naphthovorans TaxID=1348774 RepID=A0A0G3XG26_9SPHN|nr:DUF2946 family protein [Croceicoccus naphthovorans]AKM10505.1 hypothetical protein AB433_11905 [Croceicoccus naphthovorans]MBB3988694.1 hypothetical protein [Croceicoccus naphthovorans]
MRRALRLHRPGACVWLLLVATLFMRAVMPAGYMAEAKGGSIVVDICNSDATWRIPLPAKKSDDHAKQQAPCAFAGFAHAALTMPDVPTVSAVAPAQEVQPRLAGKVLVTRHYWFVPPATGPPLTV